MVSKEKKQPENHAGSTGGEFARRFKSNPLIYIGTVLILVIVIVAFVLVPAIVPSTESGADLTFGYYNKVPISYVPDNYFYMWQQNLASYYQSSLNDTNYQFVLYQIWRQAYDEAVVHTAKVEEMKSAGYVPPADRVDREVAQNPRYQENGRFSVTKYRQENNNTKMNIWRLTQDDIAAARYDLDLESLVPSAAESSFISSMTSPQRRFDMAAFPIESYPDSEIASYAAANPRLFRLTHLSRVTVFSSEREARGLLAAIQSGSAAFEDTARASSQDMDAEKGGDMGSRMAYELNDIIPDESLREEVINLSKGSYSGVISVGDNSWAFFRAEEDARPADTADAAAMEKIRLYVFSYERGQAEDWVIGEAEKFIANVKAKDFDSAVLDAGITKQTFGPLPVNYGDVDIFPSLASSGIEQLQSYGSSQEFWRAAFSAPLLSPSTPVVLGSNVVVVYPLEETVSDPSMSSYLEMYFQSVLSRYNSEASRSYFLLSDKLDDRFGDVFSSAFMAAQ